MFVGNFPLKKVGGVTNLTLHFGPKFCATWKVWSCRLIKMNSFVKKVVKEVIVNDEASKRSLWLEFLATIAIVHPSIAVGDGAKYDFTQFLK